MNLSIIDIGHAKEVIICVTWKKIHTVQPHKVSTSIVMLMCLYVPHVCPPAAVIFKLNYTVMMLLSVNDEKSTHSMRCKTIWGNEKWKEAQVNGL